MLAIAERRRALARMDGEQAASEALRPLLDTLAMQADDAAARDRLALYRPLLEVPPGQRHVCAHLGQSIDGHIATRDGRSRGLNGAQNLDHLHRLRALSDAIIVGAATVIADDPALTTRRVTGPNPVRVILDGRGRLDAHHRICHDGEAATLILTGRDDAPDRIGQAEVVRLPRDGHGHLAPEAIFACLAGRGLDVLFVEGGGITVSWLLGTGLLDRLQITIAPVLLGDGVRGLTLASVGSVEEAPRPPVRQFRLGPDRLWDFALRR